ncbi:MAG: DUF177 domain-containing protein [Alphaproteobacteria bacterium]|nr:DUF177 domain-containing protein [Alphaproteobacteria bacterium]
MADPDHKFHRWINPLGRNASSAPQVIEATAEERASLAAWLEIPAVNALKAIVSLAREAAGGVAAKASFEASVGLVCGISLETFTDEVKGTGEVLFSRDSDREIARLDSDTEIDLEADEPRPWTSHGIDLGAWIAEELSLALPDFPRKPGAAPEAEAGAAAPVERENPFAVLKGLKKPPA